MREADRRGLRYCNTAHDESEPVLLKGDWAAFPRRSSTKAGLAGVVLVALDAEVTTHEDENTTLREAAGSMA